MSWFPRRLSAPPSRARRRERSATLSLETLEPRYVFSAAAGDEVFQVSGDVGVAQQATMDWLTRDAGYNNEFFLYKVDDSNGTIGGLAPGASGYVAAALGRAQVAFVSGAGSGAHAEFDVLGGDWYAVGLVQNGTVSAAKSQNPGGSASQRPLTFLTPTAANVDGFDHFHVSPESGNVYRLMAEDLTGGGDKDYNDAIFTLAFTNLLAKGDLDILAPGGGALSEEAEDAGVVIGRNSDDDNGDGEMDFIVGDEEAVSGENDLRAIVLRASDPATDGGKYTLDFDDALIKIWKNADRTEAVSETEEFATSKETTLYVEGIATSKTSGDATIDLVLHNPAGAAGRVLDTVKFTVVELDLRTVTFSAATASNFHPVTNDAGNVTYTAGTDTSRMTYEEFQYSNLNTGDDQTADPIYERPIAFTRGATATAEVRIRARDLATGVDTTELKIRGRGYREDDAAELKGAFDFEGKGVIDGQGNIRFDGMKVQADGALADEVDYMKNLNIVWTVSFDDGATWLDAGESSNPTYVTYADRTNVGFSNKATLEPILDLAVVAADGLQGAGTIEEAAAQAADLLWEAFKDRDVKILESQRDANGEEVYRDLKYYSNWSDAKTNAVDLVKPGVVNGECVAFSTLFEYAMDELGFGAQAATIQFSPKAPDGELVYSPTLLLIGDYTVSWTGPLPGPGRFAPDRYVNTGYVDWLDSANQKYNWVVAEEVNQLSDGGLKGQGDTDPPSHFNSHNVVQVGNVVYDPSYGEQSTLRGETGRFEITDPALGFTQFLIHYQNTVLGGVARVVTTPNGNNPYYSWDVLVPATINSTSPEILSKFLLLKKDPLPN